VISSETAVAHGGHREPRRMGVKIAKFSNRPIFLQNDLKNILKNPQNLAGKIIENPDLSFIPRVPKQN
jgi:hypothetical protein